MICDHVSNQNIYSTSHPYSNPFTARWCSQLLFTRNINIIITISFVLFVIFFLSNSFLFLVLFLRTKTTQFFGSCFGIQAGSQLNSTSALKFGDQQARRLGWCWCETCVTVYLYLCNCKIWVFFAIFESFSSKYTAW